jgi:hypothetical protein
MPILVVQAVVQPNEIPIAGSVYLVLQQLGPAIFIAVAQAVFLNDFLARVGKTNPEVSEKDILYAGATGLKDIIPKAEIPAVLVEYVRSLDRVFQIAAGLGALAVMVALGVQWKGIKKKKVDGEKEENEEA